MQWVLSQKDPLHPPSLLSSFPPSLLPCVFPCAPSGCGAPSCQFGQRPKAQRGLQSNQVHRRKLSEGYECCRHSFWLGDLLCCGVLEAGRVLWGKSHSTPVLAFLHFFLGHLLLATAAHSVPSWMPTSLVKGGSDYILHLCRALVLFVLLIPFLWLFP